jgi:hypothetical protein
MRRISILLALIAAVVPPAWAYFSTAALYENARAEGVYVCGLPAFAAVMVAVIATSSLSGAAVIVGAIAYRRITPPRPRSRRLELLAVGLPLLVGLGIIGWIALLVA